MWLLVMIVSLAVPCIKGKVYQTYTLPDGYGNPSKIQLSDDSVFIGAKNILVRLDSDLQLLENDIIGPVNNSQNCKPFDTSCILRNYNTVDNEVSLLLSYKSYLFVCGTAHQGLCFRYNKTNLHDKWQFELESTNFLGSKNSSVMLASKFTDKIDIFIVGQSYDGREQNYFYAEFITLDLYKNRDRWKFDKFATSSSLSVCDSKRNSFQMKFLYIFEMNDFVFRIFLRSILRSGHTVYETRISSNCKSSYTYESYEEMAISCKNPTAKYDIGLAAVADGETLFMTFGVSGHHLGLFEADIHQGSVLCTYNISQLITKFNSEVLTKCYHGSHSHSSPSWQCDDKSCTPEGVPEEKNKVVFSCNQTKMRTGIESRDDGYIKEANYTSRELLTSIISLRNISKDVVAVGSSQGFIRKIIIPSSGGESKAYSMYDVTKNRSVPINKEMGLDNDNYLYVLHGNQVTKLSMTSCELHLSCDQCVTSEDPLGCGWCYNKCLTQRECKGHTWHQQTCPPFIRQIEPTTGPLAGGTKIIILGENFGDTIASVATIIGTKICSIQTCNNTVISCVTPPTDSLETTGLVQVMVASTTYQGYVINGSSEQNNITYHYKNFSIDKIWPMKGILSGHVTVTLFGQNLDIGSSTSVKMGAVDCILDSVNDTVIECRTTSCHNCSVIHDRSVCSYTADIIVRIDAASFTHNAPFCFTPDPEVIPPLSRSSSILSGGLTISVAGSWFDSVSSQVMQIHANGKHLQTTCKDFKSGSLLKCQLPNLSSLTNDTVDAARKLLFGGHELYSDTMKIYPDPDLHQLESSTHIDIDLNEKVLELKGNLLSLSLKREDYKVTINGTDCPVVELSMTSLRCNLSTIVHIQNTELPVEVSAGSNWKRRLGHIRFEHVGHSPFQRLMLPVVISLGIFILCIIIALMVMKKKHLGMFRKKLNEWSVAYHSETHVQAEDNDITENSNRPRYVRPEEQVPLTQGATSTDLQKTAFDACEITDMLKQQNIYIERDAVELGEDIGHGNFGCVYKGYLLSGEEKKTVAIKTILKAGSQDVNSFLDEAMIMKDFNHPNVLSLIGISVASGEFPLVILPFMANGDLLSFIRNEENKPTVKDLVKFGQDVGKGMEYLGSIKFVHRDLAARNCMLDEEQNAKVADFGLTRDIYTKNYYSSDNKKMLPVKWMAPESLENGTYSIKSDVWSFGVVMWELMTRGSAPYADVDNWDMLRYLQTGRRLKRPNFCPPQLYEIMLSCWEFEAEDRSSFPEINQRIAELVQT